VDYVLSEPPSKWVGLTGFLDESVIQNSLDMPHPEKWLYLLCGPPVMLDNVIQTLKSAGIPKQRIIFEKFSYL
jgi:Na+-transporting NADH:ubiquinone oxidoreductase subunit NqrF